MVLPFYRDAIALAAATLVATAFILFGYVSPLQGMILLTGIAAYVTLVYFKERGQPSPAGKVLVGEAEVVDPPPETLLRAIVLVISGR